MSREAASTRVAVFNLGNTDAVAADVTMEAIVSFMMRERCQVSDELSAPVNRLIAGWDEVRLKSRNVDRQQFYKILHNHPFWIEVFALSCCKVQ